MKSKDPASGNSVEVDYSIVAAPALARSSAAKDGSLNARDMWGRDPLTREIIRVVFDGSGTIATVRSSGWTGDKLVLEGDARSKVEQFACARPSPGPHRSDSTCSGKPTEMGLGPRMPWKPSPGGFDPSPNIAWVRLDPRNAGKLRLTPRQWD